MLHVGKENERRLFKWRFLVDLDQERRMSNYTESSYIKQRKGTTIPKYTKYEIKYF